MKPFPFDNRSVSQICFLRASLVPPPLFEMLFPDQDRGRQPGTIFTRAPMNAKLKTKTSKYSKYLKYSKCLVQPRTIFTRAPMIATNTSIIARYSKQ